MKKTVDINNTLETQEMLNEVVNEFTEAEKIENLETYYDDIKNNLDSKNSIIKERAMRAAAAFTQQLTQLVLKQSIDKIDLSEKENKIISKFTKKTIPEGNSIQFILPLNTGTETYSDTPFVPTTHTDPQIEQKTINYYKADGSLGDWSFQWHKMLTLRQHEWVQYFKTNTLSEFIATIRAQMVESITLLKRAKIQKFLKNFNFGKQITGNAANEDCYDAFIEFMDHVDSMQYDNIEYNIVNSGNQASKNVKAAKKSDLLILINKKTLNLLRTGIKARLTNVDAFNLEQVVDADNIVAFNKLMNDNVNTSTVITTSNDDVIGVNEIKVIDKQALLLIDKLEFNGNQLYNRNMSLEIDLHYWFMIDFLPWRKGFKFSDIKLSVVPQ